MEDEKPANFEDAVKAAGYGKFNILLMFIMVPCSFAQLVENVSSSYVVPIAQCDLELTLEDKGILNSVGYAGMILSGMVWGYICDSYGRRKVVIYGYLLNSLCYILASSTQSFPMLLAARFCGGIMFTGPFSAITSYIAEFHSASNRALVQLIRGMTSALATLSLPLIGWAILPTDQTFFTIGNIVFHSWNIFLLVCSIPALISAVIFIFLPESPKFLMTQGKNEDALCVFQLVHKINSGKAASYPIKYLVEEKQVNTDMATNPSLKERITAGFHAVKPLFSRPYILTLIHVCMNALAIITGIFGLKLWYPQILQSINDYENQSGRDNIGMCNVVESLTNVQNNNITNCTVNMNNSSVYINSAILGTVHLSAFIIAGIAVNKLGKKTLAVFIAATSSVCTVLLYFVTNLEIMLVIFPITLAFGELAGNILLSITLELFPTSFRITAINFHLMSVRMGSVIGNVIFPYLLRLGCLPLSLFMTCCICVSIILTSLLPSTENKALE